MKAAVLLASCALLLVAAHATAQTAASQVFKVGDVGVTNPRVLSDVKPVYTGDAMSARVQGSVKLECVVNVDGTVGEVKVVKPLHPGLDEEATKALRQWRFAPGRKGETPVPVIVEVEMAFTLQRKGPPLDSSEVYLPGVQGASLPRVLRETKPSYTVKAKESGVQGVVRLQVVVLPDGTVGDTRVSKSLDPGLDGEALKAVQDWRFEPGRKDGKAVPVQVMLEMTFTLR